MADLDPRWEPRCQSITISKEHYEALLRRERELIARVDALTERLATVATHELLRAA